MIERIDSSAPRLLPPGDLPPGETRAADAPGGEKGRRIAADSQPPAAPSGDREKDSTQPGQLTEEEKRQVEALQAADRKVRQHEMAHQVAGAGLITRGAQFQYERGPDGRMYAVSGEVEIDTSEVPDDPRATIEKMKRVQRAALAPSDPSAQDRRVAAEARAREMTARMELMKQTGQPDKAGEETEADGTGPAAPSARAYPENGAHSVAGAFVDRRA